NVFPGKGRAPVADAGIAIHNAGHTCADSLDIAKPEAAVNHRATDRVLDHICNDLGGLPRRPEREHARADYVTDEIRHRNGDLRNGDAHADRIGGLWIERQPDTGPAASEVAV